MANNSVVLWIARLVDVDPAGVIFLLTLLATYPLSLLYLTVFRTRSTRAKSLYLAGSGIALATAAYGINVFHSLVNCCFCYLVTRWLAPRIAIVLTLVTTMVYLLVGYRLNQVDWTYSITWTIPQCILTLRLIAFSFDIYDGQNKQKKSDDVGSSKHLENAIEKHPSLLHFLAFCYFPGTFIVGPLIPYATFVNFLHDDGSKHPPSTTRNMVYLSLARFAGGFLVLALYLGGSHFWPIEYLQSDSFTTGSFWWKLTAIALVTKIYMYKYIMSWLFAESSCILSGITYNGIDHYQYVNIHYFVFETSTSFRTIIKSYNISTNTFAFRYIYRRLKFLGNAYLSQFVTLFFLSVWHGFESGYHVSFSMEFLLIYFEKHFTTYWSVMQAKHHLKFKRWHLVTWCIGKLYTFYFFGYSLVPFMYLYAEIWLPILREVYFIGHITTLIYAFGSLLARLIITNLDSGHRHQS